MNKTLLLFRSTRDVIRADRACRAAGVPAQVIPVPRTISSECGMALEIRDEQRADALRVIGAQQIRVDVFDSDTPPHS
jgi:hypothetical protein